MHLWCKARHRFARTVSDAARMRAGRERAGNAREPARRFKWLLSGAAAAQATLLKKSS